MLRETRAQKETKPVYICGYRKPLPRKKQLKLGVQRVKTFGNNNQNPPRSLLLFKSAIFKAKSCYITAPPDHLLQLELTKPKSQIKRSLWTDFKTRWEQGLCFYLGAGRLWALASTYVLLAGGDSRSRPWLHQQSAMGVCHRQSSPLFMHSGDANSCRMFSVHTPASRR